MIIIAGKFCLQQEEKISYRAEKKVLTVRGKNSLPNGGKFTLPPAISAEQVRDAAERMEKTRYGEYLMGVVERE